MQEQGTGWRLLKHKASNLATLLGNYSGRYSRLSSDGALHTVPHDDVARVSGHQQCRHPQHWPYFWLQVLLLTCNALAACG